MEPEQPRFSILVIGGFAPSLIGFRGPLVKAMRDRGHSVTAAAPDLRRNPIVTERLDLMGVRYDDISLSRTGMNPLADVRSLLSLIALMRSRQPDVVLAYTMKAVIFGLLAARIARVPRAYALITGVGYAFTGRAAGKRWLAQFISKTLYRLTLRHAATIFFQNGDDESLFRQLGLIPPGHRTMVVNGSGIDLDEFQPAPIPSGPIRFLLVARLLTTKGVREYAAAAAAVGKSHPEVEFHLVGGFDSNPDAIPVREVEQWQRQGILTWHGEVSDVRPFIADCQVYVLPSYREGTPRSVLEAMAMGRPIITTDAPGCRETVTEGHNGFLVPPRSVEPLVRAMEQLIAKPEIIATMGRHSRELAESKYDVRLVNACMMAEMGLA